MSEVVSFRTERDFRVKLGKEQLEITIPRLKFVDAREVLEIIAKTISGSTSQALEVIGEVCSSDNPEAINEKLAETLKNLITQKSFEFVKKLFNVLTYGKVSKDVFKTMEYAEVVALVKYLIEQNFESLKNLYASLQIVTSSPQK